MCKSKKKEKRKFSYDIDDVILIKKAIDETAFHLLRTSSIEDVAYFERLLSFGLDLGELFTGSLKDSEEPVLQSPEYDFDVSAL